MNDNGSVNWTRIYRERRDGLREALGGGAVLWLGHSLQPRNYKDNAYPFRQNSHFLYYTGLAAPELALLSFADSGHDILFAPPVTMDDIVWSGAGDSIEDMARSAGIEAVGELSTLGARLQEVRGQGATIHYLRPYQASSVFRLAELLAEDPLAVNAGASDKLRHAVSDQRSFKTAPELSEIEDALSVTARMYAACMRTTRPGRRESEIAGIIHGVAAAAGRQMAYNPIVSVRGEVLHNHSHDNVMEAGQLLLNDSGAESPRYYASDITRTIPVSGRFTNAQAEVYDTVLRGQLAAIEMIRPGPTYREVHQHAATVMAEGLTAIGLMKGNPADAVAAGAHALFFPHGLGHMLGLDVHDMEDLGDVVGYPAGEKRSKQFGLSFLRLSKPLEPGYVLTVEPGIYFIPALIDKWRGEGQHAGFINYDRLEAFRNFGGIRIEDNIVVTETGARVLGPPIPRTRGDIEAAMAAALADDPPQSR